MTTTPARVGRTSFLLGLCFLLLSTTGLIVVVIKRGDWLFAAMFLAVGCTGASGCFVRRGRLTGLALTVVGLICSLGAIVGLGLTNAEPPRDSVVEPRPDETRPNPVEPHAGKSLEELIQSLRQNDHDIRTSACRDLEKLGPTALPALPALIEALNDQDQYVRCYALDAIGALGPDAASAVPVLIRALREPNYNTRTSAAGALGKIGPKARSAIPAIIALLSDVEDASDVRAYAADALGDIGEEPQISLPALAAALKREPTHCRRYGGMAFYSTRDVHRAIADSLVRFGRRAVPVLIELLDNPKADVRWAAMDALLRIGPNAQGATDAICKRLQDEDVGVQDVAVCTLVAVGAPPERIVPLFNGGTPKQEWSSAVCSRR